jgi:Dolichyl-phosphate-mannose-protein mannosyltransferase
MDFPRILFVVGYALSFVLMFLCAVGMGAHFFRNNYLSFLERTFYQACIGLGAWSYALFVIAASSLLYPLAVFLLIGISLFGLFRQDYPKISNILTDSNNLVLLIVLIASTYPLFLLSLYPPHSFDDTAYHLTTAQVFVNAHSLAVPEYVRYPLFNGFMEVLYTAPLLFGSDICAQLICTLCYVLCLLGLFVTIRRYRNALYGLLAIAVFLNSAIAIRIAPTTFVEIPTALMCLASISATLRFACSDARRERLSFLALAGVFSGFAVSCKYTAIPFVLGLGISILCRDKLDKKDWKIGAQELGIFLLAAAACSILWFGRNYYYTGNPTFPYLWKFFGLHYEWTTWDHENMDKFHEIVRHCPVNLIGLVRALWLVSFGTNLNEFRFNYCLLFLPALLLGVGMFIRVKNTFLFLVPTVMFLIPWFLSSQNTRFLLVILPMVAILAVWPLEPLLLVLKPFFKTSKNIGEKMVALLLGIIIGTCPIGIAKNIMDGFGAVPINNLERQQFLATMLQSYPAYMVLNAMPHGDLYAYGDEQMHYFYKNGTFIGDWFGKGGYIRVAQFMISGKTLHDYFIAKKIRYFLVNKLAAKDMPMKVPGDQYFREHFRIIFENEACVVYQINA